MSRQRAASTSICIIADGMDQSKWELPRDAAMKGKEFSTLQKVKLHVTCCICHGYFVLYVISNADTKKDANASIEILSHALSMLQKSGVNLAACDITLQHDNTCREFKNNGGLRWAATQVSASNIRSFVAQFLRSGHTHEDVDQGFAALSKHLLQVRQLHTPEDAARCIQSFLDKTKLFRFEPERKVCIMDEVRDWTLVKHAWGE